MKKLNRAVKTAKDVTNSILKPIHEIRELRFHVVNEALQVYLKQKDEILNNL